MIAEPDKYDGIVPETPENIEDPKNLYYPQSMLDLSYHNLYITWYCPNCEKSNGTRLERHVIKSENGDRIECGVQCGISYSSDGDGFDTTYGCGKIYHFKADIEYYPTIKNIEFLRD